MNYAIVSQLQVHFSYSCCPNLLKHPKMFSAMLWYIGWFWQRYLIRQLVVKTVCSRMQILKCAQGFFAVKVHLMTVGFFLLFSFFFPLYNQRD